MNYEYHKHFTLEQANALIPYIRRLFDEVRALLLPPSQPPILSEENAGFSQSEAVSGNGNGNGNRNGQTGKNGNGTAKPIPAPTNYAGWSEEKRHEAAYRLLNALQDQGIVVQDVERGLIDFPFIRDGEEVFLCYELKDGSSIGYFHAISAGFAGRKEINGEQP